MEVEGCACGRDHETMPTDFDPDFPEMGEYELVCRVHKRHIPCRPCMYGEGK